MTNPRILITGGLGYVGGRVTDYLSKQNRYDLRVSSRSAATAHWAAKKAEIVALNFEQKDELTSALNGIDTVIHMAAANEIECAADPEKAMQVNTTYTIRLLDRAIAAKVKRIIYLSTAHVYGSLEGIITEDRTIPKPTHPYAISHKSAEDFLLAAQKKSQIEVIVLRLSNSIGYPMDPAINRWTLVGNDFCKQAILSSKLTINSSGMQWRDFIALSEVARAIDFFIKADTSIIGDGVYNLGGEFVCRIKDIADMTVHVARRDFGLNVSVITKQMPTEVELSTEGFSYSVDKLKCMGFDFQGHPREAIELELSRTLQFCKEHFL
jgi:UDP-glucose 4-epimerase